MAVEKLIRDGKVAVLYSPGFTYRDRVTLNMEGRNALAVDPLPVNRGDRTRPPDCGFSSESVVIHSSYLDEGFSYESRKKVMKHFRRMVKEVPFDAVVVTGTSGLLMGPLLAHATKKELLVVRKSDGAHSKRTVEGWWPRDRVCRFVFLDDQIDTGATVKRVGTAIKGFAAENGLQFTWAGLFLWRSYGSKGGVTKAEDVLGSVPSYHVDTDGSRRP